MGMREIILLLMVLIVLKILWLVFKPLALRLVVRGALEDIGKKALGQQPDTIHLERQTFASWNDAAAIEALARPLLAAGFSDCGVYTVDKMPGVKMQVLLKE